MTAIAPRTLTDPADIRRAGALRAEDYEITPAAAARLAPMVAASIQELDNRGEEKGAA
jgi:hypothetical protein